MGRTARILVVALAAWALLATAVGELAQGHTGRGEPSGDGGLPGVGAPGLELPDIGAPGAALPGAEEHADEDDEPDEARERRRRGRSRRAEPRLKPTPQARCLKGSRPETGLQGQVTQEDHDSGRAARGFRCNAKQIGSHTVPNARGTVGGFRVERYVDADGHECAYYDTTLLFPTNIDALSGVNVLDMSDPRNPVLTATLVTPAMQTPHESLRVNAKRGLLAAVTGNPAFAPGLLEIYDISQDCRQPELISSTPTAILGHESGWSPDGRTFYVGSAGGDTLVAIDVSNPSLPVTWWIGNYDSHGLEISNDGNRAYVAGIDTGLIILDTSEIQARVVNPTVREVARLQWESMSIPQNAIPVTIDGHPYLVEIDEFGALDEVGAGRIIDIKDETKPRVVSNLRLEVHQPKNFDETEDDPGASNTFVGSYAAHYCNVPKRKDPGIVACSMILSGLRVFDIRDPKHPREIAYFNSPVSPTSFFPEPSNWAMSSPSFAPKRGEIWYSDGLTGFFAVRITHGIWPFPKCRGRTSTIDATGKRTRGTPGDDVIVGRRGNDRINARGGEDIVCGAGGDDVIKGGDGDDKIRGDRGHDELHGEDGGDRKHR